MNRIKRSIHHGRIIALLTMCLLTAGTYAQKNLSINRIFERYGKQKGSTMVVLSDDVVKSYHLDFYKSITLPYDKQRAKIIQQSLEIDKQQAKKIKEVISNGIISSGYYQLPTDDNLKNRYILFKVSDDAMATLVFMIGDIDSEEIVHMLFMKSKKQTNKQ